MSEEAILRLTSKMGRLGLFCCLLLACSCGAPADAPPEELPPGTPVLWPLTIGLEEERPAEVRGPAGWTGTEALPVVFVLHGYGASATMQETFVFRFTNRIELDRFLLVLPEGATDSQGRQFWNATDVCCDFDHSGIDDVGYLAGLLDELESNYNIDSSRVYFTGHSNGGFMSYRMACEHPERIAGILSLAGSSWGEPDDCRVGDPVSVLHVHGTEDDSVLYAGEENQPGAAEAAARWAERAGCDLSAANSATPLDLVESVPGEETDVLQYRGGCLGGKVVDLWTVNETGHLPIFNTGFADAAVPWLLARSL
ncbi:MAG: alpha/beta hydrolase-fold protein [Myxococcota bacterium]|nr:alpha/beta hydrolase-fold protein [Myxococcota bacterium]